MNRILTKSCLLVLALWCVAELVVRIGFARNMSGRFEYGYHPTSGFVEESNGEVRLVRAGGRRFHPQNFSRQRPDEVYRILVVGDSVPRGPSLERAYAYRLGELLRAEGVKAESLNLAVPGYGVRRSQIVLRQALKYKPNLIILHLNNSNEFEDERDWQRAQSLKSWHPRNWPMKSLLVARLYEAKTERVFWLWLPPEVRNQDAISDAGDEITASQDAAKVAAWRKLIQSTLNEDVELATRAQVPLLIVTQARVERQPDGAVQVVDYGLDEMVQPLLGTGVRSVSMKQLFGGADGERFFADGSHLRDEGHERLARAIIQELRASGLVKGRP